MCTGNNFFKSVQIFPYLGSALAYRIHRRYIEAALSSLRDKDLRILVLDDYILFGHSQEHCANCSIWKDSGDKSLSFCSGTPLPLPYGRDVLVTSTLATGLDQDEGFSAVSVSTTDLIMRPVHGTEFLNSPHSELLESVNIKFLILRWIILLALVSVKQVGE